jgi:hypothetical protein
MPDSEKKGPFGQLYEDIELAKRAMDDRKWGAAMLLWKMALKIATDLDLKDDIELIKQKIQFCMDQNKK